MNVHHPAIRRIVRLRATLFALAWFLLHHSALANTPVNGSLKEIETQVCHVVEHVLPAVVDVGRGTGVIISEEGLVLTCHHVIDHLDQELIPVTVSGNHTVQARRLGHDRGRDLALLQIVGERPWPYAELGYSCLTEPGQWCLSLGYPSHADADRKPLLRIGRVLAVSPWWLAADSLTEGGDCGGPIFDLSGKVIAINRGGFRSRRGTTHIPIDVYRAASARLQRGDRFRDPWSDEQQLAAGFGILPASGVERAEIAAVIPDSSADKAGLRAGDIVVQCEHEDVERLGDLLEIVGSRPEIHVTVSRHGKQVECKLAWGRSRRLTAMELMSQLVDGDVWLDAHPEVEVHQRNSPQTRERFKSSTSEARLSVVVVWVDGKRSRLGAVVHDNGIIVTTADDLPTDIQCQLADGRKLPARLLGQSVKYNLAILKVDAADLTPLTWRDQGISVGTFVANAQQHEEPIAFGVVSAEPRPVRGSMSDLLNLRELRVTRVDSSRIEGLQPGDVIQRVNGTEVASYLEFIDILRRHSPGDAVTFEVARSDETQTLPRHQVQLESFGFPEVLLHDAAIGSYHYGGPVVDLDGKAVGINVGRCGNISTCVVPAALVRQVIQQVVSSAPESQ